MKLLFSILLSICAFCPSMAQEGPEHKISIYFGGGNYYISENQKLKIQEFIFNIPHVEQYSITIHSHTDNVGGVEFNNWLSKMRSQSAFDQLLLNNINQDKIEIKDFGLHNPVYDNSTWEGKQMNRKS